MKFSMSLLFYFIFCISLSLSCSSDLEGSLNIPEVSEEQDAPSNGEDQEEEEQDSEDEEGTEDEESSEGDDEMDEENEDEMEDGIEEEDNDDAPPAQASNIVAQNGQLHIEGTQIRNENNDILQLRGMSLFWSQYAGEFYNANIVEWLKNDWQITVIRAAMGIQEPMGFLVNPEQERQKVYTIIDTAIEQGLYVIVDWHSHNAENELDQAVAFFSEVAQRYGDMPNIIYEPYNEPIEATWDDTLKPYHEAVIAAIREHDPDNIVICGTRLYSQRVDEVIGNKIDDPNVAYTLHYYASTHKQELRDIAQEALDNNIALFVTEYGVTEASGDGFVDTEESRLWWDFMDENNISHCNWSVVDKDESASIIVPGASNQGQWPMNMLTQAGRLVRDEIKSKNPDFSN